MALAISILLAVFVLEEPWNWVAVAAAASTTRSARWSLPPRTWRRRRVAVGTETLVGRSAVVSTDCMPDGQVRVAGEIWRARCDVGAGIGAEVVVREVRGLTLVVEPV